jgi:hypothetical protein
MASPGSVQLLAGVAAALVGCVAQTGEAAPPLDSYPEKINPEPQNNQTNTEHHQNALFSQTPNQEGSKEAIYMNDTLMCKDSWPFCFFLSFLYWYSPFPISQTDSKFLILLENSKMRRQKKMLPSNG